MKDEQPMSGDLRRSINIIKEWSNVMGARWKGIFTEMQSLGMNCRPSFSVTTSQGYKFGLDTGIGVYRLSSKSGRTEIEKAILDPNFSMEALSEIRELIAARLSTEEANLHQVKSKGKSLPAKVIDEFGADIMQYRKKEGGK